MGNTVNADDVNLRAMAILGPLSKKVEREASARGAFLLHAHSVRKLVSVCAPILDFVYLSPFYSCFLHSPRQIEFRCRVEWIKLNINEIILAFDTRNAFSECTSQGVVEKGFRF